MARFFRRLLCIAGLLSVTANALAQSLSSPESGDGVTHAVPIYEGHHLPHAVTKLDLAGRDITGYLGECLGERWYTFETSVDVKVLRDIKENLCYLRMRTEEEMEEVGETRYEMPDGEVISIANERYALL